MTAADPVLDDEITAAVPATHQIRIRGVWRDALFVHEAAQRLFGDASKPPCDRVRTLIRTGQLYARSTGGGGAYLIPVDAYIAYLRGETYPRRPS